MIRKLNTLLLTFAAFGPALNIVCQAQTLLQPLTHQVREVTLHGQAKLVGRLPAAQSMRLVLVLPLRNQPGLEQFLQELYDPSSPSYRQFLSVVSFSATNSPTQEDYNALISFAQANGFAVVGTSRNRLNADVIGPVAAIEAAFHLTLGVYQHPTENRTFYAPDREPTVALPVQLWHISGLDNYSIPKSALSKNPNVQPFAKTGSCPSASFCGSDMRAAYYGGTQLTGAGQTLGLLEYVGTDLADLNTYYQNIGQTNNVPVTVVSTDGTDPTCFAPACDDTEQTLDMTQALGMAPGLSSLVMYVGSLDTAIFNAMATASPLDAQLSSSWSWYPPDPSTDDPYFQEFAAQGQNLFQAAGDSGAWMVNPMGPTFVWPADSPYVTCVGGTVLQTVSAGGPWASEAAWSNSGGGISVNMFPIPSWQVATAAGCSSCSQVYRNGPDVAANSGYTFYVCANQTACTANLYGGTSFAAPMWAGYLALANQLAASSGDPPFGFINPPIYRIGLTRASTYDFHDTTIGSNGFAATPGYDLATGWGSPAGAANGSPLIDTLAGYPVPPGYSISASPSVVTVVQGQSGTATVKSTAFDGFRYPVALAASGQPVGVTVTFSPSSISGNGTSTMTIAVGDGAPTGEFSITVAATFRGRTQYATISLFVDLRPNFVLRASPSSITVAVGKTGTTTILADPNSAFNSAISLAASVTGSDISVTLAPSTIPAPGHGKSTMTVSVGKSATAGTYTITVTGTGGGVTNSTTATLTVTK